MLAQTVLAPQGFEMLLVRFGVWEHREGSVADLCNSVAASNIKSTVTVPAH
jgi:hypothetical protein